MKPLGPTDPQRVGQYRLLGKLGAGGMGAVFLARSDRGRTVAVKLVQPELARQPEFRQRFQQEVDAARRIGGEWTAPVLGCDTEAETPWVATGYVAGPSLHEVVTSTYGNLPERTLRILANGLVKALRDIHAAGLVHRDLKPSNVLITIDGPRVIDFGIARALESGGEGLTRTGAAVGSPGFMSPEQCRGETVTAASDIFCLGSVLTFAATGRTPFGDPNSPMTALMLRIVQGEQDLAGVPEGLRGLIESCLAQDPAHRPTLDQLLRWTEDPGGDDGSGEPWLPGALVAILGRHAIELLDSEDPLQAPPKPSMAPPPAMPSAPPPVTPLPPTASPHPGVPPTPAQLAPGTPPPSPVPSPPPPTPSSVDHMQTMTSAVPPPGVYGAPAGGYGYPQAAPGTPVYGGTPSPASAHTPYPMGAVGAPAGPGGPGFPGGPGGPGGSNKRTMWIIVAAAVCAIALVAGIAVVAMSGGDSDDSADDENSQGPSESPGGETTDPDPDPDPEPDPTPDEDAMVPAGLVGAWEGEITDEGGAEQGVFRRIEISEGTAGEMVATTWNVYAEVMCVGSGDLVASDETAVTITITSEMTRTTPSGDSCTAYGEQTLELRSDGTVLWRNPGDGLQAIMDAGTGAGEDSMPTGPIGVWSATTDDGTTLDIDVEAVAAAGELAITYSSADCAWEAEMVSGTIGEDVMLVGPGEVTSGACDPLPAYWVEYYLNDDFEHALDFRRPDGTVPSFTASYESYF